MSVKNRRKPSLDNSRRHGLFQEFLRSEGRGEFSLMEKYVQVRKIIRGKLTEDVNLDLFPGFDSRVMRFFWDLE